MRLDRGLTLAVALLAAAASLASEPPGAPRIRRLVRSLDWTNGFPWSFAGSIEQDRQGFLWISTPSGLFRFDGTRARMISPESLGLAEGSTAAGRVILNSTSGQLFEGTPKGVVPLDDVPAVKQPATMCFAVATDGTPWRALDGVVARLGPGRTWIPLAIPASHDDPPHRVHPGRDRRIYVSSASTIWLVAPDLAVSEIGRVDHVMSLLERADGTIVAGANQKPGPVTTRIFEIKGGARRVLYEERGSRLLSITERDGTIWVSMDEGLQGLGPGGVPRGRIAEPIVHAPGRVTVDREDSLWVATPRGVVQVPEPDVWSASPSRRVMTREMARTSRGVWGTFWGSLAFLEDGPEGMHVIESVEPHYAPLCLDGAGRVWTAGSAGRVASLDPAGVLPPALGADRWDPHGCGEGSGRRRWIPAGERELWTVAPEDSRPHRVPVDFGGDDGIMTAAEGSDGALWLSSGSKMCAASAADVLAGKPVAWRCEEIRGASDVVDFQAMPSGDIWVVTAHPASLRRRAGGRWEVIPASEQLSSRWPTAIAPSPSGGFWIVGFGVVARVAERPDLPGGWEVLERPTAWQGLTTINVVAAAEDADGTLWLGTDMGILKVAPAVRRRRADPPAVALVETSVDGVPLDPAAPVRLPYRRNRLEARFAALSFRDPAAVRYRVRLRDEDAWSAPTSDGRFNFVDLAPGRYVLEVASSLDGARWTQPPVRLEFRVLRPWYAEPWFLGAAAIGIAGSGHLVYRMRAGRRIAQERQRTRIAMDLHDEVGSGLGTIAVLAGIAGRQDLGADRRGEVAGRIAAVSQELARSLGDIVWSLRTSSGTLDALWNQLLDRARPLFASGSPRVAFAAPEPVPDEPLSLVVRRNLHLVAYEALHNAARHSGASVVALRLARDGAGWCLEVEDDGRGLDPGIAVPTVRRGLGLTAMKARVAEMGGTIAWEPREGGGTRVVVRFRTGEG